MTGLHDRQGSKSDRHVRLGREFHNGIDWCGWAFRVNLLKRAAVVASWGISWYDGVK